MADRVIDLSAGGLALSRSSPPATPRPAQPGQIARDRPRPRPIAATPRPQHAPGRQHDPRRERAPTVDPGAPDGQGLICQLDEHAQNGHRDRLMNAPVVRSTGHGRHLRVSAGSAIPAARAQPTVCRALSPEFGVRPATPKAIMPRCRIPNRSGRIARREPVEHGAETVGQFGVAGMHWRCARCSVNVMIRPSSSCGQASPALCSCCAPRDRRCRRGRVWHGRARPQLRGAGISTRSSTDSRPHLGLARPARACRFA
jgi:hypothetical protein